MEVVLVLAVVGGRAVPDRRPAARAGGADADRRSSAERAELEAAKEAKFREIRDAELDYRTGKLSREDWRALDTALRAEAIELLRRLDALEALNGRMRAVTPLTLRQAL